MKEQAKLELQKIEHMKRSWESEFIRNHEIWLEIAMNINSTKGKEYKFWCLVMDLYHEKYKS